MTVTRAMSSHSQQGPHPAEGVVLVVAQVHVIAGMLMLRPLSRAAHRSRTVHNPKVLDELILCGKHLPGYMVHLRGTRESAACTCAGLLNARGPFVPPANLLQCGCMGMVEGMPSEWVFGAGKVGRCRMAASFHRVAWPPDM